MREIDVQTLDDELREGAVLVDVRQPAEYVQAHVPGARLVPMGHLPGTLHELDRTRPVHLICATGNRSAAMADFLVAAGYDAVNVAGGTAAWLRSGRPVERGLS